MTGRIGDLTTIANVKAWRQPAIMSTTDDAALQREITACSKFVLNYIQRTLVTQSFKEIRNGTGQPSLTLRNRPLISVSSVTVDTTSIPVPQSVVSSGFTWDSNPDPIFNTGTVYLRGYYFCDGVQNVQINYTAGYLIQNEAQTINNTDQKFQCSALGEVLSAPYTVAYANGTPLTAIPSGTPATGQYVAPTAPDGFYQFASGDANAAILISYSYTPRDIEAACITTVILEYNRRNRIGEDSKILSGETVVYTKAALTQSVVDMLASFIDVALVGP